MVGQLGDVDKTLNPFCDLDEGSEGDELGHPTVDLLSDVDPLDDLLPRVLPGLLEAERDALAVAVYLEDLDLDVLTDLDDLARVVDVLPTEFGDVDQTVDALQVDEGPEVDEVGDGAPDDHALFEGGQDTLALLLALLLEDGAPRKNDVVAAPVQLDDLAFQPLAEERVEVPDAPYVDQARWQKAPQPDVQDQASLHYLDHGPLDGALVVVGLLDAVPGPLESSPLGRQDEAPVGVLLLHDQGFEALAELDDVVGVCTLAYGEFVRRDQTLRLVADVDEYLVPVYPDDLALNDVPVFEIYKDALVDGDDLPVLLPEEVLHGQLSGRFLCGVSHETVAFLYFA